MQESETFKINFVSRLEFESDTVSEQLNGIYGVSHSYCLNSSYLDFEESSTNRESPLLTEMDGDDTY